MTIFAYHVSIMSLTAKEKTYLKCIYGTSTDIVDAFEEALFHVPKELHDQLKYDLVMRMDKIQEDHTYCFVHKRENKLVPSDPIILTTYRVHFITWTTKYGAQYELLNEIAP